MFDGKNARKKFEESVRAHRNVFEQRKSLVLAQLPELELLLEKRRQLWMRAIQTGEDPMSRKPRAKISCRKFVRPLKRTVFSHPIFGMSLCVRFAVTRDM